jgi:hypothetical protein
MFKVATYVEMSFLDCSAVTTYADLVNPTLPSRSDAITKLTSAYPSDR